MLLFSSRNLYFRIARIGKEKRFTSIKARTVGHFFETQREFEIMRDRRRWRDFFLDFDQKEHERRSMKTFPSFFAMNFRSNDCNKILSKICVYLMCVGN